jgi:hypothetical protein
MDPTICLIKNKAWANPKSNLGLDEGLFDDFSTIKDLMTNLGESYWYNDDYNTTQLGIIGNIYVNLAYIYSLVTSKEIESGDRKEKNDIAVFDFLKSLMSGISTSIGNVANFDVFTDPVDGKGRIIDINYTNPEGRNTSYDNAFIIETHNLKSTVRSYKLESQIFPEQSSIVAIGAQAKGGALGENNNTLIDFNQNLTDRVIPKKEAPTSESTQTDPKKEAEEKVKHLKESLDVVIDFINEIDPDWWESVGDYDVGEAAKYCNALKDIINFWTTYVKNDNKNRSLIPTKLSLELDGIGGIVIGNLFRIPEELLPRGYKGDGAGPTKIGYIVTGLGHSLQNNDWKTNIDAQFIILDEPKNDSSLSITEVADIAVLTSAIQSNEEQAIEIVKKKDNPSNTSPASGKRGASGAQKTNKCSKALSGYTPTDIPPLPTWSDIKNRIGIKSNTTALAVGAGGVDNDSKDFAYFYNPIGGGAKSGAGSRGSAKIKYIVLHYTVSDFIDPLYHYKKTWQGVRGKGGSAFRACADFTIGYDGKIAGFKNYKKIRTNHYGAAGWNANGINSQSIGIEIESFGFLYYCQDDGKYYTSKGTGELEIPKSHVCVTKPYRGLTLWQKHTDEQIASLANLLLSLYWDGAIDQNTFIQGCTGTNRYNILFPEQILKTEPPGGIITHGTGSPKGKVDTFPQPNMIQMLDDLPNMVKQYGKIGWNWSSSGGGSSSSSPAGTGGSSTSSTFDAKKVADAIFKAMDGCGTDENAIKTQLKKVSNQADWDGVVTAYGGRTITCSLGSNFSGGIRSTLRNELNDNDWNEVVGIIQSKGIKWQ